MLKVVFTSLLIVAVVFFLSRWITPPNELVSPVSEESKQGLQPRSEQNFLQNLVDKNVFDENKEKVKTEAFSWAEGDGEIHQIVAAPSYIVVDKDGKVVYSKDADTQRATASLTKLMTAMVVLDLASLDESFEVQKESVGLEPTTLMVDAGEKIPVADLLEAMLITSANDAADVAARGIAKKLGGSPEVFVMLMNEKARSMGLSKTSFANPTGYDDPKQVSSVRELAQIAHYATTYYPDIARIVKIREATIEETPEHKYYELPNWNSLLGVYPGVNGVKIGFTDEAGYVMITTAERGSESFTVVLLGAPDRRARDLSSVDLLNSAFSQKGIKPFRVGVWMLQNREAEWGRQLMKAKEKTRPWGSF